MRHGGLTAGRVCFETWQLEFTLKIMMLWRDGCVCRDAYLQGRPRIRIYSGGLLDLGSPEFRMLEKYKRNIYKDSIASLKTQTPPPMPPQPGTYPLHVHENYEVLEVFIVFQRNATKVVDVRAAIDPGEGKRSAYHCGTPDDDVSWRWWG